MWFFAVVSPRKRVSGGKALQEAVVGSDINQLSNGQEILVSSTLSMRETFPYWLLSSYMKLFTENVVHKIFPISI